VPGPDSDASLDDHALAAALARRAAELLVELRGSGLTGRALGDEGDQRSHTLLTRGLAAARPHDAVLSEEGRDGPARLDAARVWIIDPLDGTREYGEPGRDDWAVHVALWAGGELAAGAVALPASGTVLATPRVEPPAARRDASTPLRIVVSRSRPPEVASELAGRLGAELVELGSAGAKTAAVVRGEVDAYVHAGGQYEWDSAAPVAVARAAGLHASRLDGGPLVYNRPDPYLPDLLVCRAELASTVLEVLTTSR
jgi:3'(2'), 5'-bisphosphate nucleotidase